jgi:colanic acid/amylovoran biosynthesis glycosyltransferase
LTKVTQMAGVAGRANGHGRRVAFVLSRFPKITETFILYEILALERLGIQAEVFALIRERQPIAHAEAMTTLERVRFAPFMSRPVLRSNWRSLRRRPRLYLRTLAEVLRGTWGSRRFFLTALAVFPKAVHFAEQMRRLRIEHVHAHFATHPTVVAFIVSRLTGIPFSFTAHGSDLHVDTRMIDRKLAAASFAVTCSQFNKKAMVEASAPRLAERIHVIYYGVDLDFFQPTERPPGRTVPRIICVASFEEVKGHRFLLEACRLLLDRGVPFELDLVGDGPRRRQLERQVAEAELERHVTFHGPLTREEVARLLGAADIKVLASYPAPDGKREGMPNVLIEAMAAGLPVVSTKLTGIPELVESGTSGILVTPAHPAELADALERLCNDEQLRLEMGRAGRLRVEREFDREQNARRLAAILGAARGREELGAEPTLAAARR